MSQRFLGTMFAKFGVVKDVFIPRKRSKTGKRFGFVRYDRYLATEIAIRKTNGIWLSDKDLKVKMAEFRRSMGRRLMDNGNLVELRGVNGISKPRQRGDQVQRLLEWIPKSNGRGLTVYEEKSGAGTRAAVPDAQRVTCTVNGSTSKQHYVAPRKLVASNFRSSYAQVAKFRGHSQEFSHVVKGVPIGNEWLYRSVVATFDDRHNSDTMLGSFIEQERGDISVRRLGSKRVLITFPSEDRMSSFMKWGEVLNIEEDTAKCIRCDIGKVKISTSNPSVINHQMKLIIGWKSFVIRVAEEQSVFKCNSDFNCSFLCHKGEDEQTEPGHSSREDDDVEHCLNEGNTDVELDNSQLLITGSRDNINSTIGRERKSKSLGEDEMRGFMLESALETQRSQGEENGEAVDSRNNGSELIACDGPNDGNEKVGGELVTYDRSQEDRDGLKRPFSSLVGPIMNREGINLEVVLGPGIKPVHADMDMWGTDPASQLGLGCCQEISQFDDRMADSINHGNVLSGGAIALSNLNNEPRTSDFVGGWCLVRFRHGAKALGVDLVSSLGLGIGVVLDDKENVTRGEGEGEFQRWSVRRLMVQSSQNCFMEWNNLVTFDHELEQVPTVLGIVLSGLGFWAGLREYLVRGVKR
ncbi:hypothetical protein Dimus_005225 [Dionaea muscipula]